MKNISTLLFIITVSLTSYAQEWETVVNRGPDGCYTTQIIQTVEIKNRGTALDSEKYHYTIKVTFENPLDVGISFDFRYHDSYGESTGRISLKPGRKTTTESSRQISRDIPWNTALNIQPVETSKLKYQDFEILGEKIWQSKHINCLEHFHIYEKKKMKEIRDKLENKNNTSNNVKKSKNKSSNAQSTESSSKSNKNSKEQTSSTQKDASINEVSENQGYEVLDVDTSSYEAEKEQKRQQAEQTAKRDSEQITKENRKEQLKAKQLADSRNFINNQKQQAANQERLNQELANDLTQTFNQISNSWAKERDFQSKISTLTNIRSVNASSIISEARSKAQQINIEYNREKNDALNQGVSATQNLVNSAQNEKQAIAGGILGLGFTALSQARIEKERKNAQARLENEKQQILKKLSQKIINKFEPITKQHKEAAIYAVKKENEDYHLAQYKYAKCMSDNAYKIVVDDYSCEKIKSSKPASKSKKTLSGQDYFNAYKRKRLIPETYNKAGYFLELAIKKEPKNTKWLLEKLDNFELSTKQQLAIMKHCLEIDKNNLKLKKKYTKKLRLYSNMKYAVESTKNDLKKVDVHKIKEQKVKDLNPEFEDVKFINDNVFLIAKFSGKTSKQWVSGYTFLRETVREKPYGLVDSLGNIIAPIKYKQIGVFSEGKATALIKKKYGFINLKGETVIPFKFKYRPSEFKNGYSIIYKSDKVWNLMFDDEKTFQLFIDSSGKEINGKKYDKLSHFSEGLALTGKAKLTSYEQNFINKKGDVVIPLDKYYGVNSFSEGMAAVQIKSTKAREQSTQKWGFINTSGDIIIDCIYDYVSSFVNNQAIVKKNNKKGIIDKQNAIVIPIEYDEIYPFVNGYALIVLDNKTGLINKQNEIIVPPIYDASYYNSDMDFGAIIPNYIFLKKNYKWGVLNKKGEVAVDFKYNSKKNIFELFE